MNFNEELQNGIEKLKAAGLYRELKTSSSAPGRDIVLSGKNYINFSSNNYLALAEHPDVKKATIEAIEKFGTGGTSSRLVGGTFSIHTELEEKLAAFKKTERALVYPAGFQTNLGIISTLAGAGDCLIMDRLNHASLWDGAKLSGARIFVYRHADAGALEKVLKRAKGYKRKIIITDSVFSMDGDTAPLKEIVALAKKYGAVTMIDEAHSTGVLGKDGRGLAELAEVEGEVDIIMGTLSKALGSQGGFVCGSRALIEYLVNKSRAFIYTTSIAPACAGAALAALSIVHSEPARRGNLLALSADLRQKLKGIGINTAGSVTQIIPAVFGSLEQTLKLSNKLFEAGIFAPAIRPPTVPEGECRLRFSLTSDHNERDLIKLIDILKQ
jgi:8-amino-7-oxononanoate synthase